MSETLYVAGGGLVAGEVDGGSGQLGGRMEEAQQVQERMGGAAAEASARHNAFLAVLGLPLI